MTTRERWIVYPLLMFSLMMGIKAHYFQDTLVLKAEKIECTDLTVDSINGRPARLASIISNITSPPAKQSMKDATDDQQKHDQPPASDVGSSDDATREPATGATKGGEAAGEQAEPPDGSENSGSSDAPNDDAS